VSSVKIIVGISLILVGVVFVNPFASGIANICTDSFYENFLSYQTGCNIQWASPTYPIFMPLFVTGIVLVGWTLRDMRRPPQIESQ
jgi:hypothetical protein